MNGGYYTPPQGEDKLVIDSMQQPYDSSPEVYTSTPQQGAWPHPDQKLPPVPPYEHTILGLRRTTFILSVMLALVVLAAGVGGGVGGTLAVQNARNSAQQAAATIVTVTVTEGREAVTAAAQTVTVAQVTVTTTATTSKPSTTATGGFAAPTTILALDCPALDDKGLQNVVVRGSGSQFETKCGYDYIGSDLLSLMVYSLNDCMHACVSWNTWKGSSNACAGVTFNADMTNGFLGRDGGNCWLKKDLNKSPDTGKKYMCSAIIK